jgi:hypothetical protein
LQPSDRRRPKGCVVALRSCLLVASVACLVGAGLLLWSQQGDAVFNDVVLAALAWCF